MTKKMFDPKKNIDAWRDSFLADRAFSADQVDELEGHMYDRIEALIDDRNSEEAAFRRAVISVGDYRTLRRIYRAHRRRDLGPTRYAILFTGFIVVNLFLMWTEPLWLRILPFFEPDVLVSPVLDKILTLISYVLVTIQLPAGFLIDILESYMTFGKIEALIVFSLLSAFVFDVLYRVWHNVSDRLSYL